MTTTGIGVVELQAVEQLSIRLTAATKLRGFINCRDYAISRERLASAVQLSE
jgi:hypothetical protein